MTQKSSSEPTLFLYVVDHDLGFAPSPFGGYCTLVHCKFGGKTSRMSSNWLTWVIGTGGKSKDSAEHGRIIYLMRVAQTLPFSKYLSDGGFQGRSDCQDFGGGNKFALVSQRYFYFGKHALPTTALPKRLTANLAKRGAGFRSDYPPDTFRELVKWFRKNYENGMHADPCGHTATALRLRLLQRCWS